MTVLRLCSHGRLLNTNIFALVQEEWQPDPQVDPNLLHPDPQEAVGGGIAPLWFCNTLNAAMLFLKVCDT